MPMSRLQRQAIGAIMAVLFAAMIVVPGRACAETVLNYDPESVHSVADNITRLNVNKLEKGARDYVKGAHLAIIEKETGNIITEWVSDGSVHEVARNAEGADGALNVETVYILRELSAPDGYTVANDVEFMIHSDNFNTTGEILSGTENGNAESSEIHGSGPEQAFVINLYDEATVYAQDTDTRTNKVDKEVETKNAKSTSNQSLTKTGDETSYLPVVALLAAGAAVIVVALIKRKKDSKNDEGNE